jgi:hypothetical protein
VKARQEKHARVLHHRPRQLRRCFMPRESSRVNLRALFEVELGQESRARVGSATGGFAKKRRLSRHGRSR